MDAQPEIFLFDYTVRIAHGVQYWYINSDEDIHTMVYTRYDDGYEAPAALEVIVIDDEEPLPVEPLPEVILDRQAAIECRRRLQLLVPYL